MTSAVESSVRLLIVEDDLASAALLRELLEPLDSPRFAIRHVTTAREACEVLERRDADVVLLDLGLPDAAELEALKRLQDCVSEIPVIILTNSADEAMALQALSCGAEDYLLKGYVDSAALIRSLRYAIERHRNVRDLAHLTRQLEVANENLERLTLLDPLTDVMNRRGLQQALSREIENLQRHVGEVAVLLVDIDDFKSVNQRLGHAVGDVTLKEIARRLQTAVRTVDYVGRLGGDEFMLLLPEADAAEVVRIAERVRLMLATTIIQHSSGTITLTACVAVVMLTVETPSIDELLSRMHELLSRSKRDGKNRVAYDTSHFDDTERRRRLQADMCANLSRGKHLHVVKQPIMRLSDESPVGYEFLSRYSNAIFEMPDNFFRICAERNILTAVDHFCLRRAVAAAADLAPYVRFHLNVFPTTLLSVPIQHLLETFPAPLPRGAFCLEISEQQIIGDPSYLIDPVRALRAAGLLIAIDDVGFGSSCLESLVLLEPDVLKIDKRCVIGISREPQRIAHLRRYLEVARTLAAEIVAEGVETADDLAVLRDLGVAFAQGFYWGRPA
jgi:diguanylate cyclase (GGDEF)-like protein